MCTVRRTKMPAKHQNPSNKHIQSVFDLHHRLVFLALKNSQFRCVCVWQSFVAMWDARWILNKFSDWLLPPLSLLADFAIFFSYFVLAFFIPPIRVLHPPNPPLVFVYFTSHHFSVLRSFFVSFVHSFVVEWQTGRKKKSTELLHTTIFLL